MTTLAIPDTQHINCDLRREYDVDCDILTALRTLRCGLLVFCGRGVSCPLSRYESYRSVAVGPVFHGERPRSGVECIAHVKGHDNVKISMLDGTRCNSFGGSDDPFDRVLRGSSVMGLALVLRSLSCIVKVLV